MSIRTKVSSRLASSTSRRTFAYASSGSSSSPRWVSLSARFACSRSAFRRRRTSTYCSVTATASASLSVASPRRVVLACRPSPFSRRSTATHSSSVSPATKRDAPSFAPWLRTKPRTWRSSAAARMLRRRKAFARVPTATLRLREHVQGEERAHDVLAGVDDLRDLEVDAEAREHVRLFGGEPGRRRHVVDHRADRLLRSGEQVGPDAGRAVPVAGVGARCQRTRRSVLG